MTGAKIVALLIMPATEAYRRLGLACADDGFAVGGVAVKFTTDERPGLIAVGVAGATQLPDAVKAGGSFVVPPSGGLRRAEDHLKAELQTRPFPLKRLDHLASVAYDLDAQTRYWVDTLGVPLFGEVVAPTMVIRQFRLGDAIFELLGPNGEDSPIRKRSPGLISMASWEVDDLDAVVAQARAAGFTPSDPAAGVLPGTRTATIPATELGGVAMQLLQYVKR
ncbi:MAG: VOC family protein [Gemmataceae bacterium]